VISCSDLPKLKAKALEKQPAPVILLEGANAASPQIADLIDLKVLIDVPVQERHRRLDKRESDQHLISSYPVEVHQDHQIFITLFIIYERMIIDSFDNPVENPIIYEN
jgi:uridine kinase